MKRLFGIIFICLFLIGLCIADEIIVENTLHQIQDTGEQIYEYSKQLDSVSDERLLNKVNDLLNFWDTREVALSFFTNHKDIRDMGIELTKCISYAKQDNREEFNASIELVIYYTNSFHQVMGVSFQNII